MILRLIETHLPYLLQLVTFALAQQFGVIFRDHMPSLNISKTQVATIINIQIAVSAFTGELSKTNTPNSVGKLIINWESISESAWKLFPIK